MSPLSSSSFGLSYWLTDEGASKTERANRSDDGIGPACVGGDVLYYDDDDDDDDGLGHEREDAERAAKSVWSIEV